MAAELLDEESLPQHEAELIEDIPPAEVTPPSELIEQLEAPTELQPDTEELPDKYRGKSIQDVVAMHQEAEKLIGKHSGEVGELRQYVDGFIKTKLQESTVQPVAPEEKPDFFEDPDAAVSNAIESHPAVRAATQQAQQFQQQTALGKLQTKHPDMKDVLGNPKFAEWVKGSPVRMDLFSRADHQYDFDCADELISQYKERTAVTQQAVQTEAVQRQTQVKAAATGSTSGASTAGSKRMYRRADIIKLMRTDPERYQSMSDEIFKAYAEGRVK